MFDNISENKFCFGLLKFQANYMWLLWIKSYELPWKHINKWVCECSELRSTLEELHLNVPYKCPRNDFCVAETKNMDPSQALRLGIER
jgi:hypothetical protein